MCVSAGFIYKLNKQKLNISENLFFFCTFYVYCSLCSYIYCCFKMRVNVNNVRYILIFKSDGNDFFRRNVISTAKENLNELKATTMHLYVDTIRNN